MDNTIRSRFVDELPAEHVEIIAELGLQPSATWASDWGSPPAGTPQSARFPPGRARWASGSRC